MRLLRMILCLLDTNALAQQLRSACSVSYVRAVSLRTATGLRFDQVDMGADPARAIAHDGEQSTWSREKRKGMSVFLQNSSVKASPGAHAKWR